MKFNSLYNPVYIMTWLLQLQEMYKRNFKPKSFYKKKGQTFF